MTKNPPSVSHCLLRADFSVLKGFFGSFTDKCLRCHSISNCQSNWIKESARPAAGRGSITLLIGQLMISGRTAAHSILSSSRLWIPDSCVMRDISLSSEQSRQSVCPACPQLLLRSPLSACLGIRFDEWHDSRCTRSFPEALKSADKCCLRTGRHTDEHKTLIGWQINLQR